MLSLDAGLLILMFLYVASKTVSLSHFQENRENFQTRRLIPVLVAVILQREIWCAVLLQL